MTIFAAVFFAKLDDEISHGWVPRWVASGLAGLITVRIVWWLWLASWSHSGRLILNVAVVGPDARN